MKKSIILLSISFLLFSSSLSAQLLSNTTFTTSSSGWFRLGSWDQSDRGSIRVVVALRGGTYTPQSVVIDAFKSWGSGTCYMDIKGINNGYIEQIRIVEDSGSHYVEAYFDRAIINNGNIHLYSLEGVETGFVINSGALPSGGGEIKLESGNIVRITRIENNLNLIRDLSVDGTLSIGTTSTGSHKLAVEGSIGAREIKVEASGWSDFVFDEGYELRTLEEVEKHITEKGHLPEIPNEAEVTENGINLGEMNTKLLQKIEELTLYLIEQNKEIKQLKEKVESLESN